MGKYKGVLALTKDGRLTFCTAPLEKRGMGRCNHEEHQDANESEPEFLDRVSSRMLNERQNTSEDKFQTHTMIERSDNPDDYHEISQDEIDDYASRIDKIAGTKVTEDNLEEVLNTLTIDQVQEISNIGLEAAPMFSLPINDDNFNERLEDNLIHFADLGEYGIAGNTPAISQIFGEVGTIAKVGGGAREVHKSYLEGISEEDQFHDVLAARDSQIQKSVATSTPGAFARVAFFGTSDILFVDDCGSKEKERSVLTCLAPEGKICRKCTENTQGGKAAMTFKYPGAYFSTNVSEPLVSLNMKMKHSVASSNDIKKDMSNEIISTFSAFSTSPISREAAKEKTAIGKRRVLFEKLKECYDEAGKPMDDVNIMAITKKMTSYTTDGEPIKDPYVEDSSIRSLKSMGMSGNIFKKVELQTAYKFITRPQEGTISPDAAMEIDR